LTAFVEIQGLPDFQKFLAIAPEKATEAARIAINQTAERKGLKMAKEAMQAQVNFPRGYFSEIDSRSNKPKFGISYRATDKNLAAGITARQEPTSLSRFSPQRASFTRGQHRRGTPIRVAVNPGGGSTLDRAFFLPLRSGNIGLGIRLKNGETLTNTTGAKLITSGPLKGVALLYGPSVDQVFRSVAVDIAPVILESLALEFLRQFELRI
jgi:hypothetical protein